MTEVYIVTESESYSSRSTVLGVMDTEESANRFVTMRYNRNPEANVEHKITCHTLQTVTDDEYQKATAFADLVDVASWHKSHEMVTDDSHVGAIERRKTCKGCGASVVQFYDDTIKEFGTDQHCPAAPKLRS